MKKLFAEIVFPLPIDHAFTYHIPESLREDTEVGSRVLSPFGKRRLTGFVVGLKDKCDLTEVKDIEDVLDPKPVFSAEMLQLTHWVADYYLCSWGEALGAALPAGTKLKSRGIARLKRPVSEELVSGLGKKAPKQAQIIKTLSRAGELSFDSLRRKLRASNFYCNLYSLEKKGFVEIDYILSDTEAKVRLEKVVRIDKNFSNKASLAAEIQNLKKRAPKQARCLQLLASHPEGLGRAQLLRSIAASSACLRRLEEKGLVEIFARERLRDYYEGLYGQGVRREAPQRIILNKDQVRALEAIKGAINRGAFRTFLIHGVTGSGKTQVYIEAIAEILKRGKTAIVLVPEISLTPQMVSRFKSYFPDQVGVFHSRMSVGERYDSWRKTQEGAFKIVIGPRSAIFTPLRNIGLIVVDEEQEATYKQFDPNPRYNARDVAVMRAKLNNAVVILGSATPSIESYYNALKGKYHLLVLPQRVDNVPLPQVEIINMAREWKRMGSKKAVIFSRRLLAKIEEKLSRGEQVILLQNRRGFSSFIICRDCGHVERCPNCNITLTYHLPEVGCGRKNFLLRCHYCNFNKQAPEACPHCGGINIKYSGIGTQRVEEELKRHFPKVRLIRMDLDTTSRKGSHDRIFRDFDNGKYDILLGTQMVAKGLDFPRVTLVGVISADTGVLLPDFRACERTFQLLTQVAGRAGRRDKIGEVIIQTYSADNPALLYARGHEFLQFYRSEIKDRQKLLYPPFGRLVNVGFRGREESQVERAAKIFVSLLDKENRLFQVLGPAPCPLARIKKEYRWQIVLKGDKRTDPAGKELKAEVRRAKEVYENRFQITGVKLTIDVDPLAML